MQKSRIFFDYYLTEVEPWHYRYVGKETAKEIFYRGFA